MSSKGPKGTKFIAECLGSRATSITAGEQALANSSLKFVGVFMNQVSNWLLNFIEVQMYGAGEKFFWDLQSAQMGWRIVFEMNKDYITVSVSLPGKQQVSAMYSLEDLASAKDAGQWVMERIGERKKHYK